jgi:AICAR transformylase/IMP cyclohydrolase PurH
MTALGSGVAPAYAADGTGAVTAKNQYVALSFQDLKMVIQGLNSVMVNGILLLMEKNMILLTVV